MFSRAETLLIALALILPEGLRSHDKALEPYPAVILPAGAGTVRIKDGTVTMTRTYLSAKRNGEWQEVDTRQFMAPISQHYFIAVSRRDFGIMTRKGASPRRREAAAETKRWMRDKLAAQGFATRRLRVVREKITVTFPSGKQVRSRVQKKSYALD